VRLASFHEFLQHGHSHEKRAAIDVVAVVDPLSRTAQRLAPLLRLLRSALNCDLKIVMNPKAKLSELPLKRFYRFVLPSEPEFTAEGKVTTPTARFSGILFFYARTSVLGLPAKQLLTLSVIPPDAWMVEAVFADYDLDNLKMETVWKRVEDKVLCRCRAM